ncbi:MAG: hypothetical protein Q8L41_05475 [Anaerolineales bacterium]|nr:hypothetical protein [Anaerolineales bacterium]MDP2776730.1 hypothetical protein [Anaerolineales bacterium]
MTTRKTDSTREENLDAIEAHLAGTLKPVAPPNGILQRLHGRIQMPSRREIVLRLTDWRRLFFVFGGVMSGMLLLVTLARMFYYLGGRKDAM